MSPGAGRPYRLVMICEVWKVPRSTVYAARIQGTSPEPSAPAKRGPKTKLSDAELVEKIREVLKASDFLGEGHRKVRTRLRPKGIWVGKARVLRVMREHGLLAPVRQGSPNGDRSHSGTIVTARPNELWGTDATRFYTKQDGWCWFFGAVDHCSSDVVGLAPPISLDSRLATTQGSRERGVYGDPEGQGVRSDRRSRRNCGPTGTVEPAA